MAPERNGKPSPLAESAADYKRRHNIYDALHNRDGELFAMEKLARLEAQIADETLTAQERFNAVAVRCGPGNLSDFLVDKPLVLGGRALTQADVARMLGKKSRKDPDKRIPASRALIHKLLLRNISRGYMGLDKEKRILVVQHPNLWLISGPPRPEGRWERFIEAFGADPDVIRLVKLQADVKQAKKVVMRKFGKWDDPSSTTASVNDSVNNPGQSFTTQLTPSLPTQLLESQPSKQQNTVQPAEEVPNYQRLAGDQAAPLTCNVKPNGIVPIPAAAAEVPKETPPPQMMKAPPLPKTTAAIQQLAPGGEPDFPEKVYVKCQSHAPDCTDDDVAAAISHKIGKQRLDNPRGLIWKFVPEMFQADWKQQSWSPRSPAAQQAARDSGYSVEELAGYLSGNSAVLHASNDAKYKPIAVALDQLVAAREHFADPEKLERILESLERNMLEVATASQTPHQSSAARRDLDTQLRPYRGKMSADQLSMLEKQFLERRLLEEAGLPRLSLFYFRGDKVATAAG